MEVNKLKKLIENIIYKNIDCKLENYGEYSLIESTVDKTIKEIKKLLDNELQEFIKFKQEWSERFGYLSVNSPRDSFESIDEVATILYNK